MMKTKQQAIKTARRLRQQGRTVRVLCHEGTYCQPGKGLATYCYYTVEDKAKGETS